MRKPNWGALTISLWIAAFSTPLRAQPTARDPQRDAQPVAANAEGSVGASNVTTPAAAPVKPDALSIVTAVVPGFLLHGAGHWTLGDRDTAYRLLAVEGAAVGVAAVGWATLFVTGAARDLVGPAALMAGLGTGVFLQSWLADIYGVAVPAAWRGSPRLTLPSVEVIAGPRYVHDVQFDYHALISGEVHGRYGPWRLSGRADVAVDDPNARWRLELAYRWLGPRAWPAPPAQTGSFVETSIATSHHRFGREDFHATTAEAFALGRLALADLSPSLRGAFTELGAGWALRATGYDLPGNDPSTDGETLLLMRFGFGVYLGDGQGEAQLYYDHRHDDYAAGLIIPGLGSGVAGHIGLGGYYYFAPQWGMGADLQRGAAYTATVSVRYRYPGER